ncbi:MAG: NADP-dependent isocitrate dehydrogenase [Ignisphaera sp.]|nr:NADP-dependent isocitrate dehydrogenase [Ignisphaera sp.]MCX8168375.1 NADP-dependent isocitrate dehydrogenase [Ignisphaera sp.]MDW8085793.1 NADP-dependent isocitrate dehydrogenase [Ignisphaera sp.]
MKKIVMIKPIVEIDGDEMARVMWRWVKERLIAPFVEVKVEYYDLHIRVRDETDDRVTKQAAEAIKRVGVGVKCATITPNAERVKEYNLKKEWRSPNATIREILDGTIFRAPIIVKNVAPAVRFWRKPIVVARHAFGDIYSGAGIRFDEAGEAEILYRSISGREVRVRIGVFPGSGVLQAYYNLDRSIEGFAKAVFKYALMNNLNVWFAAKETISKIYDAKFKEVFQEVFDRDFRDAFERRGLKYEYYLIDDAYSRAMRSEGGFVWAAKNYDGDVLSDMIAAAYSGSLAMMTSELLSPEGYYLTEAAHGTVQRHYYKYLMGEKTSTNPTAIIFAWSRALRRRGELDGSEELIKFTQILEEAVRKTIEVDGIVTQDIAKAMEDQPKSIVSTEEFIEYVRKNADHLYHHRLGT